MTFSAYRKDTERHPDVVTVRTTYGPVTVETDENYLHLRSFWHSLGAMLDVVEHEAKAAAEAAEAAAADARAHRTGE